MRCGREWPQQTGSLFKEKAMRRQNWLFQARRSGAALHATFRALFAVASVWAAVVLPASAAERAYRLQPFSALELSLPARYVIRNAGAPSALIRGPSEVVDRIAVEQHDDRVRIYALSNISIQGQLVIEVNAVGLTELGVTGSGEVEGKGFSGPEFFLKQAGAADVRVSKLDVDKLRVEMQGSGKIELSGRATKERMRLAGAGEYRAEDLAADSVEVNLEGAGDVHVRAHEKLEVSISGAGNVRYVGDPKLTTHIEGAGTVERL